MTNNISVCGKYQGRVAQGLEHYVDIVGVAGSIPAAPTTHMYLWFYVWEIVMKVRNSLRAARKRHSDNQLVRRRGRLYLINRTKKRCKVRQG